MVAYKTSVKNLIGVDENGVESEVEDFSQNQVTIDETIETIETDKNTKILLANLIMNIQELQIAINDDNKIKYNDKEELLIVLKALDRAVHLEELLIINALLVPLEHSLSRNKKLSKLYENLKMLIADIYY